MSDLILIGYPDENRAQISFATAWRCREDDNWVSSCW
jgi:hypothetical protein